MRGRVSILLSCMQLTLFELLGCDVLRHSNMIISSEDEIRHMRDVHEASIRLIESRQPHPAQEISDVDQFFNECFIAMASADGTVSMHDFLEFLDRAGVMGEPGPTPQQAYQLIFGSADGEQAAAGRLHGLSVTRFKSVMVDLAKMIFADENHKDLQTLLQVWVESSLAPSLNKSKFFVRSKPKKSATTPKKAREKKETAREEGDSTCEGGHSQEDIAQALLAFVPKRESLQRILDHYHKLSLQEKLERKTQPSSSEDENFTRNNFLMFLSDFEIHPKVCEVFPIVLSLRNSQHLSRREVNDMYDVCFVHGNSQHTTFVKFNLILSHLALRCEYVP
eukprot:747739-Hanusia_phi.AAC.2